jgi:NADPH:quinone reductase-like Zn-dependent oxidoreductase
MKAVRFSQFGGPEVLEIVDLPDPHPGPGEVRIKVRAAGHVVTVADFAGAREHGVVFSSGDAGRALYALDEIGGLIESGRFTLPVARTFLLAEVAEAHRVSEQGHVRGKLVLLAG